MKRLIILITFVLLAFLDLNAQSQTTDWIRVASDNGEFSIEVPAEHGFFADQDGFSIAESSNTYFLQEMKMLNAFQEKTLISVESYKANKRALDTIRERDSQKGESSEIKRENFRIKQIITKTDTGYIVRQYFNSKNYIYILTAAAREGETPTLRRFLDSLIFNSSGVKSIQNVTSNTNLKTVSFSALKPTSIEIDANPQPLQKPGDTNTNSPVSPVKDKNTLPLVVLYKSPASYTSGARAIGEQGIIRLRLDFSGAGYISKIAFLDSLREGLLRQAMFAALRIKFLPPEKDGKSQTVTKMVEYSFAIY